MRILAAIILAGLMAAARGAEPPSVAFVGFTIINTSLEPTSEADVSGCGGCQRPGAGSRERNW